MNYKLLLFLMLFSNLNNGSPISVSDGGTGLSKAVINGILCAGTTTVTPMQYMSGTGNAGQGIASAGSSTLPVWQNVFPGYIASAGTSIYGGTTSNLANAGADLVIINTTLPTISTGVSDITALGYQALQNVATGLLQCTAIGTAAMANVTAAAGNAINTAVGYHAQNASTTGVSNVAIGVNCLQSNLTQNQNICVGNFVAVNAITASNQTAIGYQALNALTTAGINSALGYQAASSLQIAGGSTAIGYQALLTNTGGVSNAACGYQALNGATVFTNNNTGVGSSAGASKTIGSGNIYIGYNATPINAGENNNIVIGNSSNASAYVFGITGATTTSGVSVFINSAGQLGTTVSSKRFKENIQPISDATAQKLLQLKPVSFTYIADVTDEIQYGMIAEEAVNLFPELIVYDKDGNIYTIQYHKLTPLIIKYLQNKQAEIDQLEVLIDAIETKINILENKQK